jgi:hypothetical protein
MAGALVPVLPECPPKSDRHALYPAQRHRRPRVRKFVKTASREFDQVFRYPGYLLVKLQEGSEESVSRRRNGSIGNLTAKMVLSRPCPSPGGRHISARA